MRARGRSSPRSSGLDLIRRKLRYRDSADGAHDACDPQKAASQVASERQRPGRLGWAQ